MLPLRHPSPAPWRAPDHVVVETCVENIDGVRVSAHLEPIEDPKSYEDVADI